MEIYLSRFAERIDEEEFNNKEDSNFYYFSLTKEITKTAYIGEVANSTKIETELYYKIEYDKAIELAIKKLSALYKSMRNNEVNSLIIELDDIPFNADETSQLRITRAIQILENDDDTLDWIDANNEIQTLTKSQIQEGLKLAGIKQSEIFIKYRYFINDLNSKDLATLIEEYKNIGG